MKEKLTKYNIQTKLLFVIIILYLFTVPFGIVFKSFEDSREFLKPPLINLSFLTSLILLLSILSLKRIQFKVIDSLLLVLFIYISLVTLLFTNNLSNSLYSIILFLSNILLVISIENIKIKRSTVHSFFYILAIGSLISSLATIVDGIGIFNIPYFNEKSSFLNEYDVYAITGPFLRRTSMGAFYIIILITNLLSFFYYKKIIYGLSLFFSLIAIILTFNRSAPLALVIIFLIFIFKRYHINLFNIFKIIILTTVMSTLIMIFIPNKQNKVVKTKLLTTLFIENKTNAQREADNLRLEVFHQIITKDITNNPLGYGFHDFYFDKMNKNVNVHSNLNLLLYATGIFGVFWIMFFLYYLYKTSKKIVSKEGIIIKYSLFGWLLYSLVHTTISTFLAWLFLGLILNKEISNVSKSE